MEKEEFKLGELILIEKISGSRRAKAKYTCFCGTEFVAPIYNVQIGKTKSCGCYSKFKARQRMLKDGRFGTALYGIHRGMVSRIFHEGNNGYKKYGGAGLDLFEGGMTFETFREWALNNGYKDGLSIDRIDPKKGYFPENCRWCTPTQQSQNRTKRKGCSSDLKGAFYSKGYGKKWRSKITVNKKTFHIGRFLTALDAGYAYNIFAKHFFGEYAHLNVIPDNFVPSEDTLSVIKKKFNEIE